jgi:hypothetical protein
MSYPGSGGTSRLKGSKLYNIVAARYSDRLKKTRNCVARIKDDQRSTTTDYELDVENHVRKLPYAARIRIIVGISCALWGGIVLISWLMLKT